MDGDAQLSAMIARLRAFGQRGLEEAAKEAAPLVEAAARKTAAAGTGPYGNAWPPKKDGTPALEGAAAAITARADRTFVYLVIKGGYAINNFLTGKSRRQILPSHEQGIPKPIADALREGARRAWQKVAGG